MVSILWRGQVGGCNRVIYFSCHRNISLWLGSHTHQATQIEPFIKSQSMWHYWPWSLLTVIFPDKIHNAIGEEHNDPNCKGDTAQGKFCAIVADDCYIKSKMKMLRKRYWSSSKQNWWCQRFETSSPHVLWLLSGYLWQKTYFPHIPVEVYCHAESVDFNCYGC